MPRPAHAAARRASRTARSSLHPRSITAMNSTAGAATARAVWIADSIIACQRPSSSVGGRKRTSA